MTAILNFENLTTDS